jgi:AhpD family alkylhydroperoxidase
MSVKIFQDNIFPRHVSDLLNLMHMVIFTGTDGEERWTTYLDMKQKEYVALGLSEYYQCDHCITHHTGSLLRLEKIKKSTLLSNVQSMILFLRIDTRSIGKSETEHWIKSWNKFAKEVSLASGDAAIPYLMGLAIGIARDDEFLIEFCGSEVKNIFPAQDVRAIIGELEAVVIFMKAAASKNRVVGKIERLFAAS